MSDCRRHILVSHRCPAHVLGGDRLELVMDYSKSPSRPLTIASSGIVWAQFSDKSKALEVFYDILLGRKDPLAATKPSETVDQRLVQKLRLVKRQLSGNDEVVQIQPQQQLAQKRLS